MSFSAEKRVALANFLVLRSRVYAHIIKTFQGDLNLEEMREDLPVIKQYLEITSDKGDELDEAFDRYSGALGNLDKDGMELLEFEFNRLFVGPGKLEAPPYSSVYLSADKSVFGESTISAQQFYTFSGLKLRNSGREPGDHFAIELEYLFVMQMSDLERIEESEEFELEQSLTTQKEFIEKHMLNWIGRFFENIRNHSEKGFFSAAADLTENFLKSEINVIDEIPKSSGRQTILSK
jgi:TorA maturation chaperone TorD